MALKDLKSPKKNVRPGPAVRQEERGVTPAPAPPQQDLIRDLVAEGLLEYVQDEQGRWTVVATERGREFAAWLQATEHVAEKLTVKVERAAERIAERLYARSIK